MPWLEFDVRHRYASGFQLELRFGTDAAVTGLFGPSGSGKSSVLSMIAGLRSPQAGRISLRDHVVFDSAKRIDLPPEQRRVGYVFQDHLLLPHLSVRRNLLYGARRRHDKRTPEGTRISLTRVVDVLELGPLLERAPLSLSGGEKQRVAIGRALLANPYVLLLDEPLSSVGESLRERILKFIERVLSEWHVPTLYVTHDASELDRVAQRVVRIAEGRLVGPEATA